MNTTQRQIADNDAYIAELKREEKERQVRWAKQEKRMEWTDKVGYTVMVYLGGFFSGLVFWMIAVS